MTNRIDRLATAGLVRREPDPTDKRGVLVTLTEQGVAKADAALADLLRRERALLADLDRGERQHLADLMRILLAPFDAELRPAPQGSRWAARVSQRSSRSDFSDWTARSSAPREVSFS
jgi:Winged helix DNA-binding domain